MNRIRILVVDNYGAWRVAVGKILGCEGDFEIIAEAIDGFEAIQRAITLSPDIVLMEIGLPGLNGLEAGRRMGETCPDCKIVYFTSLRSKEFAERALEIGARGYVLKSEAATELIPALKAVHAGERFISEVIPDRERLLAGPAAEDVRERDGNPFTDFAHNPAIQGFLFSAIDVTEADFGDVQLFDSSKLCLRVVAQRGFGSEFLKFFEAVDSTYDCACAWAMKTRLRVIVADVPTDPLFSNQTRSALLEANVHSLQSTPLIRSRQRFMGVVSTHYARRGGPFPEVLPRLDDLASRFVANIGA